MASPKEILNQIVETIKRLTFVQQIVAAGLVVVMFGGLLSLVFMGGKTNYDVLFSGLTPEDASSVVTKIKEQNIDYQLAENGTVILVPTGQVYDIRLSMVGQGLPRGGGVGFELFDKSSLGTTDFVQRLNYQRALQGELARTIRQFRQVKDARVHIATPKESVFIEDTKPPSASVSLTMTGRGKLATNEIQAIVNLVASAVPGLSSGNITVVDTAGRLLFRKDGDEDSMLTASQLEYQVKIEKTLRSKVESMLEEVVGVDKASARVTADIDFSQEERTEENYDPEGQVIRSEQLLTEQDGGGASADGIPGVKGQLATFTEAGGEGGGAAGVRRNNVVRNYEITRTTRRVQGASGVVKRLSVAVMVDGTYDDVEGKDSEITRTYIPRKSEEIAWFVKMTKNAIGFDEERGDQVEVVSMPFHISSIIEPKPDRTEKWRDLLEKVAMPLVLLIVAGAFLLFIVKPFIRLISEQRFLPAATEGSVGELAAAGTGVIEEEDLSLKPRAMSDKERFKKLAQSDPERAADLVRRWLREEM